MSAKRHGEKPKFCRHKRFKDGPRTPLRWGSAATQVCDDCGAWREDERNGNWSRWRVGKKLPTASGGET